MADTSLAEWQAGREYWQLRSAPVYRGEGVPKGDGMPVLVIPGLMGNDLYLRTMRQWLRRMHYQPLPSSILWNAGCPKRLVADAERPLRRLLDSSDAPVAIVGHSRGGLLAKALASKYSQRVVKLVLIGSPLGGMLQAGRDGMQGYAQQMGDADTGSRRMLFNASRNLTRLLDPGCKSPLCDCEFVDLVFTPPGETLSVTSLYSPTDPIVPQAMSQMPYGDNIEVSGTHGGLMFNAVVFEHLARILAASP
ncbi:MAG: alpha/beta fold hydrolase [Pseudomonadota bacterium]